MQDDPHRLGSGTRAGYVFAAFVLGSPIGLVMALVPEPIYDFYVEAHHRVWGLDPLEDQQLAGMLMAIEQALVAAGFRRTVVLMSDGAHNAGKQQPTEFIGPPGTAAAGTSTLWPTARA